MHEKIKFLERAVELASENVATNHGGPFGALVVKDGKIISEGVNTVTAHHDPTAHAEINAIREACKNLDSFQLDGCEIYSSCEPCPMCLGAIYWARPERLYFAADASDAAEAGFDDSFIYHEINQPHENRGIPTFKLDLSDRNKPFLEWLKLDHKIQY